MASDRRDRPPKHGGVPLTVQEVGVLHKPEFLVLMCCDRRKAKCCSEKRMHAIWKHLKKKVKQSRAAGLSIAAIPTQCLGVCEHGPLIAVFPPGQWYRDCDEEVVDSIIENLQKFEQE